MRIGTKSNNDFIKQLNQKNEEIKNLFLLKITGLTKMIDVKVMMGDSTITIQKTFDPKLVMDYFQKIDSNLENWSIQDVSTTNNEDIRRIFTKFEIMEGNYLLSGHISIQFHVLLYYKPDQRVLDCQKELSEIIDLTKNNEQRISDNSDEFVLNKLKEMGYKDLDHQKLFEIFYENDEFREKVYAEIEKDAGVDFQELSEKKTKLFDELDSLLIETYQITSVLIDDNRLITGEEGCLFTVDLEFVKNKNREGLFDPRKMSDSVKENILIRLNNLKKII
ncbi:MAG: hypothetical protein EX284_06885 [Candidatus Nitrosopumilus sp. MTA1]|uniref:Uncharacterized protein n=1 Tax=Marine Group I thaumarchaeote TaxID=2511932 RepID=A0A7K4MVF1_9ARCH|nr:MAG: hypothetical protein DSN69_06120 [Nitrosopumilus sp. YT1]NMI82827.1 hypothetical protein [Candidatus Nitrosopumilus sp. MTA1]NWJ28824.1 hypothetical protein [Marine Group I thaumarchaeote]NWJ57447.1 hypothetical protein [Marine Group I thaumarchaeote]NWJ83806.1 hypothetical protein [Marine Group I thaumarchaeote]